MPDNSLDPQNISSQTESTPSQLESELDIRVQASIRKLISENEMESDQTRRQYMRKWMEAEEFWKGNQHLFWDEKAFRWYAPFEYATEVDASRDTPFYTYVTNVYRSYGLSVIAAMSQKLPKTQFLPVSAQSETDIATAKAATDVVEWIEDKNDLMMMAIREAYLLWTQGKVFAYVRYVLDDEYGTTDQPIIENSTVEMFPDRYVCPSCSEETPPQSGIMGGEQTCQSCGTPLNDSHYYPAEHGEVPVINGYNQVPNGMEKITLYGPMNVKVMPWAQELRESGYLILAEEVYKSAVMAAFPSKADKLDSAGSFSGSSSSIEDSNERTLRLRLSEATQQTVASSSKPLSNIITYKRCWMRPWMYMAEKDKQIRAELYKRYPDGFMAAYGGDVYLTAYNDKLDAHWESADAMPGVGAYRDGIGADTISLQKRINDVMNIEAEHVDFAASPPILTDARFLNMNALRNKRMRPGTYNPVTTNAGAGQRALQDMIYQPRVGIDANIYAHGKDLIEMVQLTSGAFPAIFGGSMSNVKTASGYAMARNQALGRLELFWRSIKSFHAKLMLKSVNIFRESRTEDVEYAIIGKSKDFSSKYIHLANLQGRITAKAQVDEDFPTTWQEVRENITELMGIAPNWIQPLLMHPDNAPFVKRFLANSELTIPVETQREKSYREIDWLTEGQPIEGVDPMSGMPKLYPSVMPEIDVDDHMVHIENDRQWAASDAGITTKQTNPMGYANVLAHIVAHKDMMKALAAEQMEDQAHVMEAQITPGLMHAQQASNMMTEKTKVANMEQKHSMSEKEDGPST